MWATYREANREDPRKIHQRLLEPPPVDKLWNVYGNYDFFFGVFLIFLGTNILTEKMYYYSAKSSGKWKLQTDTSSVDVPNHVVRDGIVYETPSTPQNCWMVDGVTRSGFFFLFHRHV